MVLVAKLWSGLVLCQAAFALSPAGFPAFAAKKERVNIAADA
jgi:hypothetical protein